jgi:hypothetical protein
MTHYLFYSCKSLNFLEVAAVTVCNFKKSTDTPIPGNIIAPAEEKLKERQALLDQLFRS